MIGVIWIFFRTIIIIIKNPFELDKYRYYNTYYDAAIVSGMKVEVIKAMRKSGWWHIKHFYLISNNSQAFHCSEVWTFSFVICKKLFVLWM